MPLYRYECTKCRKRYEVLQSMNDPHTYMCECGYTCRRIFTVPVIKRNEDFFSVTIGKEVKGQTEFEKELSKLRYMNDLHEELGDNMTPKDEWIEKKMKAKEAEEKYVAMTDELIQEENEKHHYYTEIETFKFDPKIARKPVLPE